MRLLLSIILVVASDESRKYLTIVWLVILATQLLHDVSINYDLILINVAQIISDIAILFECMIICIEEFDTLTEAQSDKFGVVC